MKITRLQAEIEVILMLYHQVDIYLGIDLIFYSNILLKIIKDIMKGEKLSK